MKRITVSLLIILVAIFSLKCSEQDESEQDNEEVRVERKAIEADEDETPASTYQLSEYLIKDLKNNKTLAEIKDSKIILGDIKIIPDSKKYKIKSPSGDRYIKVKHKDPNKIKLYENDRLLWKIKLEDGKFKISDNEENLNPYFVKQSKPDFVKAKYNDKQIASMKFKDNKLFVKNEKEEKIYEIPSETMHPYFVILAIKDLHKEEALIIIYELLKRGY